MGYNRIQKVYLVTGILSNLRGTLAEAIAAGSEYGIEVKILDLVNLIPGWKPYPNPWRELGIDAQRLVTPGDEESLRILCETTVGNADLFLFLHLPEGQLTRTWKLLQKHGAQVGAMTVSLVPVHRQRVRDPLRQLFGAIRRLPRRIKSLIKPIPDVWVISGNKAMDQFGHYFRSTATTQFITTHSPDYEAVRATSNCLHHDDLCDFILFLDQGWYSKLRPDFFANGVYPPTSQETYKKRIVVSLKRLQEVSGKQIIVSAHPKADLTHTQALYDGLRISTESSATLASRSSLVIGNSTTSLQYAAIHAKPVVLFTSDELDNSIMVNTMLGFQKALSADVVNIDHDIDWRHVLDRVNVDMEIGKHFLRDYVGDVEANNLTMWQKVFSSLAPAKPGNPTHD